MIEIVWTGNPFFLLHSSYFKHDIVFCCTAHLKLSFSSLHTNNNLSIYYDKQFLCILNLSQVWCPFKSLTAYFFFWTLKWTFMVSPDLCYINMKLSNWTNTGRKWSLSSKGSLAGKHRWFETFFFQCCLEDGFMHIAMACLQYFISIGQHTSWQDMILLDHQAESNEPIQIRN